MGDTAEDNTSVGADAGVAAPVPSEIPTPAAVCSGDDVTGYVVWHRKHLRTDDQRALAQAVADGDVVCPLFIFDPQFYEAGGLACDARLRFLHEAVTSLDRLYATVPTETVTRGSRGRQSGTGPQQAPTDTPERAGAPGLPGETPGSPTPPSRIRAGNRNPTPPTSPHCCRPTPSGSAFRSRWSPTRTCTRTERSTT